MFESRSSETHINGMSSELAAHEWYERGLALRKAGLFKQAIDQFAQAANDQRYALKAYAQIGLCCKSSRQYEQAVAAFRNALQAPSTSTKETVQILYVLGRTLESLDRIAEALEVYRWLRREDSQFRDVTARIESLSVMRIRPGNRKVQRERPWTQQASSVLQNLLWPTR